MLEVFAVLAIVVIIYLLFKVNEKEDEQKFKNRCQAVGITFVG